MTRRIALIAVTTVALAGAAAPAAIATASNDPKDANTVISIEGPSANMLLPGWVAVRKAGTRTVRDSQGQRVTISARSVLSQALLGTSENRIAMKWSWYPEFAAPWITSIGGIGGKGAEGWNFRVNSVYQSRAANRVNLVSGDRVTWYWGKEFATVLEIADPVYGKAPGAVVGPGPFTVTVNEVTSKNVRTPSAGATVTYGTATGTTNAQGQAVFAPIAGIGTLRVTKAGRIAATKPVCTLGAPECPS